MDLLKEIEKHDEQERNNTLIRPYKHKNPKKGLCVYCENKLCFYGTSTVTCEYHWLKHKYNDFNSKCARAKDKTVKPPLYPHLKKIKCKFDWREFIVWCTKNNRYKKLENPILIRIDKKGHYEFGNIKWIDLK